MEPLLQTIRLTKTYGEGATAVHALKPTDLTLHQGQFVAIVGASGSGKSTLLHLLGGLDRPTSGSILLEGKRMTGLGEEEMAVLRRRKFGFIFQYYNLLPVLTAEENIVLPLLLDGKTPDGPYIEELLGWLGLTERRSHLPSALSGGQQQRVAIARALACKPSIIFADEPTGNLDRNMTQEVLDLLRLSIRKYHQTLVMITHDVQIAASADRIVTIDDGAVVDDRTVSA
ncbi:ABC transporter ATP-binding protein [Paenibacillus flagellatus]|uniref:Peptide ABC transporter ATP-binding protein n=1 Tax=Paenibacillus flagellatus TaxID=2211139 RepID=A0A2V5KKF4_9BACL|nr:ABC transporter ATP-binding protein [Paenibacillus flagellatus]PYI51047.1 peptide ABC transporter ATP-binding protein [Paenibacillus flagellatus]